MLQPRVNKMVCIREYVVGSANFYEYTSDSPQVAKSMDMGCGSSHKWYRITEFWVSNED